MIFKKRIHSEILRLAIPNIISNLSIPLLSSVDTALMGRQEGVAYIGAVALGSLIFNFVYWSFAFLRMGTTGLAAQAYGKGDKTAMITILGRALLVAIIGSVSIILLQIPLANFSFYLLGASDEVETLAKSYFYTRVWAAPATLGLYVLMGWFFGMQNALYPMILTITINIVNIIANIVFVNYFGMKADGVALGTVIAQYTGLILGLGLLWYKYKAIFIHFQHKTILQLKALKAFMSLNSDIFIRTFCLVFALAFFDNQSAMQSDLILAINGVLLQFVLWVSYGIDGVGYATESLVGKFYGAKKMDKVREAIHYTFNWSMLLAVLYSLVFWGAGRQLLGLFTNQSEIIEQATPFLIWMIIFPIISTPCYIWDGVFIGLTVSKAMRNTMLLALVTYLLIYYLQNYFMNWGNHGLWLSLVLFMVARGLFQWIWYMFKWDEPNSKNHS